MLELYDPLAPASVFGLPSEARCRLCAALWRAEVREGPDSQGLKDRGTGRCPGCAHALEDVEVHAHACSRCGSRARLALARAPEPLRDPAALLRCLERFAEEEGGGGVQAFVENNFLGLTVDELHARIARGEPVETSLDAWFSIFQRGARGGGGGGGAGGARPPGTVAPRSSRPEPPRTEPRAMVLALVSVLVADGQRDPRELDFINRFLAREGLGPLDPAELRVWRPVEIATRIPAARRAEVVELMTQLACVDGEADPSELRLVQSYAQAWGIVDDDLDGWLQQYKARYATDVQRFWRGLRGFFLAPPPDDPVEV